MIQACSASTPAISLSAVSAVGAGSTIDAGGLVQNVAMFVYVSSNSATGQQVQLQASWDGSNWTNTEPNTAPTGQPLGAVIATYAVTARYFRAYCNGAPSVGTVTAYLLPF